MADEHAMDWAQAAKMLATLAYCCHQFMESGPGPGCRLCGYTEAEHLQRDEWRLKVFERLPATRLQGEPELSRS